MNEMQLNQQVAEQICGARESNGREFHWGECVALLDGQVVVVATDLDAALRALRALDSDPRRGMVFEVATPICDVLSAPLEESDIMLDPWTDLPSPQPISFVKATPGKPLLPDVPEIPVDWQEP